jgi:hypothetical protein
MEEVEAHGMRLVEEIASGADRETGCVGVL